MPAYLHPGVYMEEIPSSAKPIEAVGTSTACFIGYTVKGPISIPKRITKFDEYQEIFGGLRDTKDLQGDAMGLSVLAFFQNGGTAAYIVRLAKDTQSSTGVLPSLDPAGAPSGVLLELNAINGGTWGDDLVVELMVDDINSTPTEVVFSLSVGIVVKDMKGNPVVENARVVCRVQEMFSDLSLDADAANYIVDVINAGSDLIGIDPAAVSQALDIDLPGYLKGTSVSGKALDTDTLLADLNGRSLSIELDNNETVEFFFNTAPETHDDLYNTIETTVRGDPVSDNPARKNFTAEIADDRLVLTSGSRKPSSAVVVTGTASEVLMLGALGGGVEKSGAQTLSETQVLFTGGSDGKQDDVISYGDVFTELRKIRDINIICLPDQQMPKDGTGNSAIDAAISHAEYMKNCMVLVDPPAELELDQAKRVTDLNLPTSTYTTLYYPWVEVQNPFYNVETNPKHKRVKVPPSGFAAGIWAKTDAKRGVWKAPAGVENKLLGAAKLAFDVEEGVQDQLNPLAVNCLRKLPGYGQVIWGARTLATKAAPEWRYVPVRRTALMIEESIYNGIQWAVFEPNDHKLWASLRLNIGSFMNGLFRAGAFQGEKASDAYLVRCGLGDTMTQGDIDRGQVIAIVGFAPLKPAEFVIIRIQQKVGQE